MTGFGFPAGETAVVFFGLVSEVMNFETRISPLDIFTFQLTFHIEFAKENSYV